MAGERKTTKAKSRKESKGDEAETSVATPVVTEEIRTELTSLVQELLLKCHELSFEYSTSDCPHLLECPIATKSKEIFKVVKKLNQLMKRVTPQYIT